MRAQLDGEMFRGSVQHWNVVADGLVRVPATLPEILAWVGGVLLLVVEERLLILGVGKAPCDVLVVADEDHGRAGDAHAAGVVAG